jgi:hypothetical protein
MGWLWCKQADNEAHRVALKLLVEICKRLWPMVLYAWAKVISQRLVQIKHKFEDKDLPNDKALLIKAAVVAELEANGCKTFADVKMWRSDARSLGFWSLGRFMR